VLKCPDDRKNRVVSLQATDTGGSSGKSQTDNNHRYPFTKRLIRPLRGMEERPFRLCVTSALAPPFEHSMTVMAICFANNRMVS
jgi:hypothetical protein